MVDVNTVRLIITEKCNLSCSYCYNNLPEIRSKFVEKSLNEIDFSKYDNICITGGEPFVDVYRLFDTLTYIGENTDIKDIYIYTNGLAIKRDHLLYINNISIMYMLNIKYNIGLHTISDLEEILGNLSLVEFNDITLHIEDIKYRALWKQYGHKVILNYVKIKTWHMNSCDVPNEDWILLTN